MRVEQAPFLKYHYQYPVYSLAVLTAVIIIFNLDKVVADYLYQLQGNTWLWKNAWLTENLLHKGGRNLSISLALFVLGALIASWCYLPWAGLRKPLGYLLLALLGSSLLVSALKASLAISCPWEFDIYGGHLPYINVVQQLIQRNGEGCFPAGHASAGYSWIALYFFGLAFQSRLRWLGLAVALLTGLVFGIAQQIRGAHFLSHDLWTLAICWFCSLSLYLIFFELPRIPQNAPMAVGELQ